MAEKQELRILEAIPPLAGGIARPLALLRRELATIIVVLVAFLVLDLSVGNNAGAVIRIAAFGLAVALAIAVLASAWRPRGSA
jgi:hypothetical protein